MMAAPTIISLNVNGLSNHHKLKSIISMLSPHKPDIICLQETFTSQSSTPSSFTLSLLKSTWSGHFFYTKHLITLINPSFSTNLSFISSDERIMDISISSHSSSFIVRNIYAPPFLNSQFWSSFPSLPNFPNLICAGDFNTTTQFRDRWSSQPYSKNLPNLLLFPSLFPNMIDLAGSLPGSPHYTLIRNNILYTSKSRIDYILISPSLFSSSLITFTIFMNSLSDHRAVVLKPTPLKKHNSLWRMNTSYLSIPYVQTNISNILLSYSSSPSSHNWDKCKHDIKNYFKSISHSFSKKNKSAIFNISNRIKNLQNSSNPNSSLISTLKQKLAELEHKHIQYLILRSRINWYEQGESPSKYFFQRFKQAQSQMEISSLFIPSTPSPNSPLHLSNNINDILNHCKSHFSSLWSSPPPFQHTPLSTYIPTLPSSSITALDSPITPDELYQAIKSKKDLSAPGPDGFPYKFYKTFPTQISKILIPIFHDIAFKSTPPPPSWSETIITLIHKKNSDPRYVDNLRPIVLSNTDIKLLSTILATRFQTHASILIHPDQTGFMKHRSIYDTILDINSFLTLDFLPPNSFALSVDWSKAYDRVSHSWLDHVLSSSLFPTSFINLTFCSYHNRSAQIKINSSLSSPFPVLQGVPQGDPFSPLLFNLSIEPLFNLIRSVPSLAIRAYADDTTIFGSSATDLTLLLDSIFPLYKQATGGFINIQKSSLFLVSPSSPFPTPPNSPPISSSLGILGFTLPITPSNTNSLWSSLITKIKNRAASLSSRSLSLKGRVLISKTLLLSKIWYYATLCPPPSNIITSLQSIINTFIWNNSKTHPRFEIASLPVSQGGISIPDIKLELRIRHAKLISKTFDTLPPFWCKVLNQFTLSKFSQSLPSCIINKRSTYLPIEPLRSCLNASKLIQQFSPSTILNSPPLPTLRSILTFIPSPPYTPYYPSPKFPHLSWKEIHHKDYPHKIQDLLWKIAHFSLPIGISISTISPYSSFCPWCPNTSNSIPHLFSDCPIASSLYTLTCEICHLLIPSSTPSSLISNSSSPNIKQISRLIFSSFLWTIWTSYTSCTFGTSSPPNLLDIFISFKHILFNNRSLFHSNLWPSLHTLSNLINNKILTSIPPPPSIYITS